MENLLHIQKSFKGLGGEKISWRFLSLNPLPSKRLWQRIEHIEAKGSNINNVNYDFWSDEFCD